MTGPLQLTETKLEIFRDSSALSERAYSWLAAEMRAAVEARGRFTLALAGGSTPRALYTQLAEHPELPWDRTELCFGDERPVPADHADSNARMAREALTARPFIAPERVHRIRGELPAEQAASDYERTLRALFARELKGPAPTADGGQAAPCWPCFDVILLGLGDDGHTASLFPHSAALAERTRWVTASWVARLQVQRITLTYPVLNAARHVLFLVAGAAKAQPLRAVLESDAAIADVPARGVRPSPGELTFLADYAAASLLEAR